MKTLIMAHTPKECEQIANGEQTIKVCKVLPKRYVKDINDFEPYKVLMYESKAICEVPTFIGDDGSYDFHGRGKVIGEYIVDRIYFIKNTGNFRINNDNGLTETIAKQTCMYYSDMKNYLGEKNGYALHISQLKIYDEPKELGEYHKKYEHDSEGFIKCCAECKCMGVPSCEYTKCKLLQELYPPITTAPKQIIYCEDMEEL